MVRHREKLTYPTGKSVSLPFSADNLQVKNPTIYTLYIRLGARDFPTPENADYYVMPTGAEVINVEGTDFGFAFGAPQIAYNLRGTPPSNASLVFTAGEFPPQLATLPLVESVGSGVQSVIANPGSRPAAIYNDTYDVPANIRTLSLETLFAVSITQLDIYGLPSGHQYYSGNPSIMFAQNPAIYIPFQSGLDSQIQVNINSLFGASNAYKILGSVFDYAHQFNNLDGRQKVDVLPINTSALPVDLSAGVYLNSNTLPSQITLPNNTPVQLRVMNPRKALLISNTSPVTIYIGDNLVNATSGTPMATNDKLYIAAGELLGVYGYQNSGVSRTINILEMR